MSRTIATILTLKNEFTAPAQKIAKSTKNINRENKRTINSIKKMGRQIKETAMNAVKDVTKMTVAFGGIAGAMAVKTGFGEAMNLEGYKTQLMTATKDAKKAGEIMKFSVDLANSTPFETGSMVEASAKLEAMGVSARAYLPSIADMAGATNKSLDQANEAIIDAQAGELERLKEFGITKQSIIDFGAQKMNMKDLVNKKGQIKDQNQFNKVLFELMESKFKGGAATQAKTFKGMWSTVTGITKISLANIVGMQKDGAIKQGSVFELLKGKMQIVGDTLLKWQTDGTIEKIADNTVIAVSFMIDSIKEIARVVAPTVKFITDNFGTIAPIILTIYGAMLLYKGIMIAQIAYTKAFAIAEGVKTAVLATGATTVNAITIAQWAWNAAMTANPIGMVIAGITGIVVAGILLWKNFDKIKAKAVELWGSIKEFGFSMLDIASNFFLPLKPLKLLIEHFDKIINVGKKAWGIVKGFFGSDKEEKKNKEIKNNPDRTTITKPSQNKVIKTRIPVVKNSVSKNLLTSKPSRSEVAKVKVPVKDIASKELLAQSSRTPSKTSLTNLNNETRNLNNKSTQNITNINNSSSQDTKNINNSNVHNKTTKDEKKIELHFHGDVYGFEDFKEKAARAIYEIANITGSNVAVV